MVEFDWGLDALLEQEQFVSFLEDTRCVRGPGGSTHTSTVAQEGVLTRVLAWYFACLSFLVAHERSVATFCASLQYFAPRCNISRFVATFRASRGPEEEAL